MTRHLDDDPGLTFGDRSLGHSRVKEAVIKQRGWYLYLENGTSKTTALSSGRSRNLTCLIGADKLKDLKQFIKKSTK